MYLLSIMMFLWPPSVNVMPWWLYTCSGRGITAICSRRSHSADLMFHMTFQLQICEGWNFSLAVWVTMTCTVMTVMIRQGTGFGFVSEKCVSARHARSLVHYKSYVCVPDFLTIYDPLYVSRDSPSLVFVDRICYLFVCKLSGIVQFSILKILIKFSIDLFIVLFV